MSTFNKFKPLITAYTMSLVTLAHAQQGGGSAAGSKATGLGGVATNITGQVQALGQLIFAVAMVAGVIFMLVGLFKLKQHKDNPTQVPIGTPLMMLVIGACLAFLPSVVETGGQTVFGTDAKTGGYGGAGFVDSSSGSGSGSGSSR